MSAPDLRLCNCCGLSWHAHGEGFRVRGAPSAERARRALRSPTPEEQVDATLCLWMSAYNAGQHEDEADEFAEKARVEADLRERAAQERRERGGSHWAERASAYVHDWYAGRFFGIIRMRRRLFNVGDIVIGFFQNGQGERWPVFGYSSRGFDVTHYYVDFQRWKQGRSHAHRHDDYSKEDGVRDIASHDHTQGCLLVCPDHLQTKPARDPAIRAWLVEQAWLARRTPVTADSGGLSSGGEA